MFIPLLSELYEKLKMQVEFGILLMLLSAASGSLIQDPVVRRFNENNQSYVALGQSLHLQLPLEETDRFQLKFTDKTSTTRLILRYRKTQSNPPTSNNTRWQFVNENNTMILTSAERSDSGIYELQIDDKTGTKKGTYSLQLNTEAQVSSVKVSYSCLSPGVMKVFCSADGDNLRFNWTSHSNPVTQLEDENSTLILNKTQHGNVTCHVENHVSRAHNVTEVPPCPEPTTMSPTSATPSPASARPISLGTISTVSYSETNNPNQTLTENHFQNMPMAWLMKILLIIMSLVCLLLIVLSMVACCVFKKRQRQKITEVISQDTELVYAQINHLPKNSTKARPNISQAQNENVVEVVSQAKNTKPEDEVQYGEVVFNTRARKKRETPREQDDCVYSQVQHIR